MGNSSSAPQKVPTFAPAQTPRPSPSRESVLLVGASPAAAKAPAEKQTWYRPVFTDKQVADYLGKAKAGAFVMRLPPSRFGDSHPRDMVLSLQAGPKVAHVLLKGFDIVERPGTAPVVCWKSPFAASADPKPVYFKSLTDIVLVGHKQHFSFPKLGTDKISLDVGQQEAAEKEHKALLKQQAAAEKKEEKRRASVLKTQQQNEAKEQKQLAKQMSGLIAAQPKAEVPVAPAPVAVVITKGTAAGSGMDKGAQVLSEEEKAKALKKAEQNEGFEHNTNDGDVDPDRDIGELGSQYVPDEVVPEWMQKKKKPASTSSFGMSGGD